MAQQLDKQQPGDVYTKKKTPVNTYGETSAVKTTLNDPYDYAPYKSKVNRINKDDAQRFRYAGTGGISENANNIYNYASSLPDTNPKDLLNLKNDLGSIKGVDYYAKNLGAENANTSYLLDSGLPADDNTPSNPSNPNTGKTPSGKNPSGGGNNYGDVYNPYFSYLNYYGNGGTGTTGTTGGTTTANLDSSYNVGGIDYSNMRDDYLTKMRALLDEERQARDKATESSYKALIGQADRNYKDARDQASVENARTQRWLDENYGGYTTGQGLTNRLRASTNLENNLANAMNSRNDALLNAESQRQNALANAVQNYSSQYGNMASNMYSTDLNNELKKYQLGLDYENTRRQNEMSNEMQKYQQALDYQYRIYLKQLGL